MAAVSRRCILGACLLLASPALAAPTIAIAPAMVAAPSPSAIQPVAMGDPPGVPRRRGGRRSKEKDKPYQPLAKDPVGESDAAHKDYLKRNGF